MADDNSSSGGFNPVGLGMSLLPTLFKAGFGIFQGHRANELAAQNQRPTEAVNQNFFENQRIAQQQAQGMPSQVYNNQQNQIQRNEASAMGNINSRNMGVGSVGRIDQMATDQMGNLNAQNAHAMIQGQHALMGANTALGNAQQHAWNTNQMQPYQQRSAAIQALRGSSEQNMYGAANDVGSLGVMMARGNHQQYAPYGNPYSGGMMGNGGYGGGMMNAGYDGANSGGQFFG